MYSCEEDVIICMWALPSVRRRKVSKTKYWIHNVFWAKEEEGEFHTLFESFEETRQKFFKYFRMGVSKFEKLWRVGAHIQWREEYAMETWQNNRRKTGLSCTVSSYSTYLLPPSSAGQLTLILQRSRTGTVWFYTSTSNKRAARPKLFTKSLTGDLKLMYSRFTLVRISINL